MLCAVKTNVIDTGDNRGDNFAYMAIHELIRAERQKQGLSQAKLAEMVGITQPAIKKIEAGQTQRSRYLIDIAKVLGIKMEAGNYRPGEDQIEEIAARLRGASDIEAASSSTELQAFVRRKPEPELLGRRDLPVFASVECGPGEMMVFSTDPIEIVPRPWFVEREPEAFGVVTASDSMEPVYEAGDITIVSPRAALVKGKDAIFTAEPTGGDFKASLKRYRGQTADVWRAYQFNPPEGQSHDLEFDRGVWRRALRVLGRFSG